ncbi:MAG TPA: DUF1801 domain-containing protein [Cellvibrio sp.]|nr:DUF1801 domain-containing protein [Cellvibrio sp.]
MLNKIENPMVSAVFQAYSPEARKKLLALRQLVLDTAAFHQLGELEETLKWGEPSYIARGGSTIRMNCKASSPDSYALYFNCKTNLVETFRELYPDLFQYQGNRAIVFTLEEEVPAVPLAHCILLALTYKRRRHLPLLGA